MAPKAKKTLSIVFSSVLIISVSLIALGPHVNYEKAYESLTGIVSETQQLGSLPKSGD